MGCSVNQGVSVCTALGRELRCNMNRGVSVDTALGRGLWPARFPMETETLLAHLPHTLTYLSNGTLEKPAGSSRYSLTAIQYESNEYVDPYLHHILRIYDTFKIGFSFV